jgi:hypothetical protein
MWKVIGKLDGVVNFIVTLALLNYEKVKINLSRLEEGDGYHFRGQWQAIIAHLWS